MLAKLSFQLGGLSWDPRVGPGDKWGLVGHTRRWELLPNCLPRLEAASLSPAACRAGEVGIHGEKPAGWQCEEGAKHLSLCFAFLNRPEVSFAHLFLKNN